MKRKQVHNWVQILTGVALLIGLALVVIEMRQAQVIATLQFTQAGFIEFQALKRQRMGDNPAPILAKACLHPEQLSDGELVVALGEYDFRYDIITMTKALGEIAQQDNYWKPMAREQLQVMLSTPLGRADFRTMGNNPQRWDPELVPIAQDILEKEDYLDCADLLANIKRGLAD